MKFNTIQSFIIFFTSVLFSNYSVASHEDYLKTIKHHQQNSTCMHAKKQRYLSAKKTDTYNTEVPTLYWRLVHTDLDIQPIWSSKQMKGKAILTITPHIYSQNKIVLNARQMDIESISISQKSKSISHTYSYDSSKITIHLSQEFKKKDTLKVTISYIANPEKIQKTSGKAIAENKGLYFINTDQSRPDVPVHMWTQGEPESNSAWFPTFDHPSVKHAQRIKVTYESKYTSLSNGKLVSSKINPNGTRTDIWEQKNPHAVYLTALIIGEYKIVTDKWRSINVNYYMEPKYENMARPIFGRTPKMIDYFSKLLNYPFPWEKYSQVIVHDYVSGAMENTSAVTFNTMFQKDARELYDNNDDETVAHELFHHWFGDIVNCESWTHLTLNESFANYSEYLWNDFYYGHDRAQKHWYDDIQGYFYQSRTKHDPLIRTHYNSPDDVFDAITYNKGGKILHMLRHEIGDEAFFGAMNLYLKTNQYKTAETDHWRLAAEETSGRDLKWFFDQWYRKGGHPIIHAQTRIDHMTTTIFMSQRHSFDSTFIYRLPIAVDIYTENGPVRKQIVLDRAMDSFTFQMDSKIFAVNIDAEKILVARVNETKSTSEWIFLLKNTPNYLDQFYALQNLKSQMAKPDVYEAVYQSLYSHKPEIQKLALSLFEKEDIAKDDRIVKKATELAKNGSTGSLRAEALQVVTESDQMTNKKEVILAALKDTSYLVESVAVKSLFHIDQAKAIQYANQNFNSKNINIKLAAYDILASTKDPKYLMQFEQMLDTAKGTDMILAAIGYGKALALTNQSEFEKGLNKIELWANRADMHKSYTFNYLVNSILNTIEKSNDASIQNRMDVVRSNYLKWMAQGSNIEKTEPNEENEEEE